MSNKETPLTIAQFKAWLEGVEEMQESDWIPNDVQWKKIREKIGKLCNDLQNAAPVVNQPQQVFRSANPGVPNQTQYVPPIAFPEIPTPMVAVVQSSGDQVQPSSLQMRAPASSVEQTIKTPNIDTSNGGYKSQFDR